MNSQSTAAPRLAIIGLGCLFPRAGNAGAYWAAIKNGVDAITEVPETHWRAADYFSEDPKARDRTYGKRGGFLDATAFNPLEFGLTPNALEATDTTQLLGLLAAREALVDAGYGADRDFDRDRVSVLLGVTGTLELVIPLGARLGHPLWRRALEEGGVDAETADDVVERIAAGYVEWQEASFPGLLGNVAAGRIANRLDLGGTNCVIDAACASSIGALHLAALELAAGKADMVVTGGMDTFNDVFMYMCFSKTPALSASGDARPFSADADGTILGEGLGVMVVKRLEDAERDGDHVYAVVRGIGTSSDGKGTAIYEPNAAGQCKALRDAYRCTGVTADTIELVEGHGTGTSVGDAAEVEALTSVYREARSDGSWCALGSVKSQIGHTKAAAGAAGIIKAALALHHKVLPPTIKVDKPAAALEPGRSPFYVNVEKRPWLPCESHPRRAVVSAFGFGGSNFHVVLEEHVGAKTAPDWDGEVQIAAFSADTPDALLTALDAWPDSADAETSRGLAARSRANFRSDHDCRLLLVLSGANFAQVAGGARERLQRGDHASAWSTPDGAHFGRGAAAGSLAFLFPGQGSQRPGMLRDLACQFPEMLDTLAAANAAFGGDPDDRLSDRIYPQPVFDAEAKKAQDAALRDTRTAQPAIGAISAGAARVLARFGVTPVAAAGHSYGELTALHAAGRLNDEAFFRLSKLRGQLMGDADDGAGGMLAVRASVETLEAFLSAEKLDLVIANRNAPEQSVLSGRREEIERAAGRLGDHDLSGRVLNVSAAFHSPLVAAARAPFEEALAATDIAGGAFPVFANVTADAYPDDAAGARSLLAAQLVSPVEFRAEVEHLHDQGCRSFVEVGPGRVLTGLSGAILGDRPHHAFALDAAGGRGSGLVDLAKTLARLAALGHDLDLTAWDEGFKPVEVAADARPVFTVPICGANYKKPREPRPPRVKPAAPVAAAIDPAVPSAPAAAAAPAAARAGAPASEETRHLQREILETLQRSQIETAELHRRFLEAQAAAQQTVERLIDAHLGGGIHDLAAVAPAPPAATSTARPASVVESPLPATDLPSVDLPSADLPSADLGLRSRVAQTLLEVVAEKTGYPTEMLQLDMGLDADLGIDSIKRVEILSALEEKLPDAPRIDADRIGSLETLEQVVAFLAADDARPAVAATPAPAAPPVPPSAAPPVEAPPSDVVLERSVLRARALEPGAPRERISLADASEVWITHDATRLSGILEERLGGLGYRVRRIGPGAMQGGLDVPERLGALILIQPQSAADDRFVHEWFALLQQAGPALRRSGRERSAMLVTISRLDGAFGCGELPADAQALGGALAGLAKTVAREWPEVQARALDVHAALDPREAAARVIDEIFRASPIEVGLELDRDTWLELRPELQPELAAERAGEPRIQPGEVIVVSGGARGVTAEATVAMARTWQPLLVLLGRSPVPTPEPEWLRDRATETEIKRALMEHGDSRPMPKQLESRYHAVAAGREIKRTLARVEAAGASAVYHSVDVTDAGAVAALLAAVRDELGPIRGLVHGAGVLADRHILEKTAEQFARVWDTKVHGALALLDALAADSLRVVAFFGSSSGRLGRVGQVDYAMANEALNKLAQREARRRPEARVVCVNWGPWAGGMVTDGLAKLFRDEGLELIPCEAGADLLVRELAADVGPVEIVVAARPRDAADPEPEDPNVADATVGVLATAFERRVDLETYPVLRAHVIDAKPVVPMALVIEWLAHGAIHNNPGLRFHGFDDLRMLKGMVLGDDLPHRTRVLAGRATRDADTFVVPVELHSDLRTGRDTLHASASIRLAATLPSGTPTLVLAPDGAAVPTPERIYQELLFHGPELQGVDRVVTCSAEGIEVATHAAPPPEQWVERPLRNRWLADPLVLDTAFQAIIVWCMEQRGEAALPSRAGRYRQFAASFPSGPLQVVGKIIRASQHSVNADLEFLDATGTLLARLDDFECTLSPALRAAFRRNRLEGPAASVVEGEALPS